MTFQSKTKKHLRATKNLFLFFLLFFPLANIAAVQNGGQALVPAGSWVYDAISELYTEAGQVAFTGNAPLSVTELELCLNNLNYDNLSIAGRAAFNNIRSYLDREFLGFKSGALSAGFGVEAAVEGYVKSNDSMPWNYAYQKRPAFLNVPMGFSVGDYLTMHMDLALQQNVETMISSDTFCNIPFNAGQFSLEFPQWTYGSVGAMLGDFTGINLKIARGAQSIGKTLTGSVILSDYSTSETWIEAKIFSPKFNYSINVTELNPPSKENPDPAYFYHHKLEFRLFKKLSLSLVEGVLVNAPFELRFLNPLMILHGYGSWRDYYGQGNNGETEAVQKEASLLGFTLDYVPCSGLRFYFLYAMNQFQTSYERKNWPDSAIPNALAFQAGTDLCFPVGSGYLLGGLESVYTTPYMYVLEGKDWSYVREFDESIGMDNVRQWVGTPFGPDTIAAALMLGYKVPGIWDVNCMYTFAMQGAMADYAVLDTDYWPKTAEDAAVSTPTGDVTYTNTIAINAAFLPLDWLQLQAKPSCSFRFRQGHLDTDFQLAVSCKMQLL